MGAGNIRAGELERAKENMKGRMLLSLESTSARMTRLGKAIVTDTEIVSIEETERRIAAVTADDVADARRATSTRRSGSPPPASARARSASARASSASIPAVAAQRGMNVLLFGRRRQGRDRCCCTAL